MSIDQNKEQAPKQEQPLNKDKDDSSETELDVNELIIKQLKQQISDKDEEEEPEEKKPKEPQTSDWKVICPRSVRFRDWCELAGMPSEDIDKYANKLKKRFGEEDNSEQGDHSSYDEEMNEWYDDQYQKAMAIVDEYDEKEQEFYSNKFKPREFPEPSQTPVPYSYENFRKKPNNIEDDVIYD